MDTTEQDDYQTMLDSWITYADGFLLIYSIDDKESFDSVRGKYERIMCNKKGQSPQIIVVGNKCDLVNRRKIENQFVENVCKGWDVNCIETSALVINFIILYKIGKN